jgi:6-phosphofructokinase 1
MNALLRAFVRLGLNRFQARILGVKNGFHGLVRTCHRLQALETDADKLQEEIEGVVGQRGIRRRSQDIVRLDHHSVSGVIDRGGIILGSSRCEAFKSPDTQQEVMKLLCQQLCVDAVVVVGGGGTMQGAAVLAQDRSLRVIGIPATIDNDYDLTERSLGFDTAVHTIVECVARVNDTASSHHRIMVLETMGRRSGQLAQTAALASGAEIVVTPDAGTLTAERMCEIAQQIERCLKCGRTHAIVLVTEGVATEPPHVAGPSQALAGHLQRHFDHIEMDGEVCHVEVRHSVLGHLQRGGSPSTCDRLLAADFAEAAWSVLLARRPQSGVLGLTHGRIKRHDFDAPPLPRRAEDALRLQRLQQDIADHGRQRLREEPAEAAFPQAADRRRAGRRRQRSPRHSR